MDSRGKMGIPVRDVYSVLLLYFILFNTATLPRHRHEHAPVTWLRVAILAMNE